MRNTHCRTCNMGRYTEKGIKMHTVGPGILRETLKSVKKKEMYIVGPGFWLENRKTSKIRYIHCRTWNMARNTEKGENERCTL